MRAIPNVEAIVRQCNFKKIVKNGNGWRCNSPFVGLDQMQKEESEPSLSIKSDGAFKCFRTDSKGFIIELYAKCRGLPDRDAALFDLKKKRLISTDYTPSVDPENHVEVEDNESKGKIRSLVDSMHSDWDMERVSRWRGIQKSVFAEMAGFRNFGFVENWTGMGAAYCFIATSPPSEGNSTQLRAAMGRSVEERIKIGEKKWLSVGSYPVWVPFWNVEAKEVYIVEGQWDAIALSCAFKQFNPSQCDRIQVIGLVGPKKLGKHVELMDYFKDKKVIQIPDNDKERGLDGFLKGEKIFCDTALDLEKLKCHHKILRLPKEIRGECKDFSDWFKKPGMSSERFLEWLDCADDFTVSNGHIIDSELRMSFGLPSDQEFEMDAEGNPIEVIDDFKPEEEVMPTEKVLKHVRPYKFLNDYVVDRLENAEAPAFWQIGAWHAAFSVCLGTSVVFTSGIRPNVYIMFVGPSAVGKSDTMNKIHSLFPPELDELFMSDSLSYETLRDELAENPQRLLIMQEFSSFINAVGGGGYRQYLVNGLKDFYDGHGKPSKANFKKSGKSKVENPHLCILAGGTYEHVQLNNEALGGGLVGRFNFLIGRRVHKDLPYPMPISQKIFDQSRAFLEMVYKCCKKSIEEKRKVVAVFSEKTMEIFMKDRANMKLVNAELDPNDLMSTYQNRRRTNLIKYSILYQLQLPGQKWPIPEGQLIIGEQAMRSAIDFVNHADTCFNELFIDQFNNMDDGFKTPEERIQAKIMRRIRQGGGATKRDLLRFLKTTSKNLDPNLEALIQAGEICAKSKSFINGTDRTVYRLVRQLIKNKKTKEEVTL